MGESKSCRGLKYDKSHATPAWRSGKSQYPCLAPRAASIEDQGFSEPVAARIEAPQRSSTQPKQSMKQSEPFLLDGAKQVRWT